MGSDATAGNSAADAARQRYGQSLREVFVVRAGERAVGLAGNWSTWADIAVLSGALDKQLRDVPPGPIALVLRNRPSGVAALLGLLALGRTAYLVSPIQPPAAIAAEVERGKVPAVVADAEDWSEELTATASGIALDADVTGALRAAPRHGGPEVIASGGEAEGSIEEAAIIVPTSGTTGTPKRIPMAWSNLPVPRFGPSSDVVINALSSTTISGLMTVLRALAAGRPVALLERLDVHAWVELVREHKPKYAGLPPAAMRMLIDSDVDAAALSSIKGWPTGSAPVPPALQEQFEERFGIPVLINYGATEFGGAVAGWTLEDRHRWAQAKRGSVGTAKAGVSLRIVDVEDGHVLGANQEGLLEVRAPRALKSNEWIRTNDLARIDEDGFLFIHGRADDVVIRGGFKVPLGEVEDALASHPAVLAAGAVGLPDPRLGQVPCAAVTLVAGAERPTESELKDWVRARAAPYKVPVMVLVVDALPETTSHKVSRPGLTRLLEEHRAKTEH